MKIIEKDGGKVLEERGMKIWIGFLKDENCWAISIQEHGNNPRFGFIKRNDSEFSVEDLFTKIVSSI